jgi:hypothetical protein
MAALVKDVKVVKTLPQNLKDARRLKKIPSFRVPNSASPYFYLHHVLPVLNKHVVVELVVSDGGCLQVVDFQPLFCYRCRHVGISKPDIQKSCIDLFILYFVSF